MRADLQRNLPFLAGAVAFGVAFRPIRIYLARQKCADMDGSWANATRICTLRPGETLDWRAFDSPSSILAAGITLVVALTVVGLTIGLLRRLNEPRRAAVNRFR
jgi:ABC-type taurine transport system substrate-binding protein